MDDMYREYILDHYRHPHNFGEMEDPSFEAEGVNPLCGDELKVQVKLDEQDRVADVRFTGQGCAISQASMSILSDELMGKSLQDVAALTREDITELLGIPLTPVRLKCALLGLSVTRAGMSQYEGAPAALGSGNATPGDLDGADEIVWER